MCCVLQRINTLTVMSVIYDWLLVISSNLWIFYQLVFSPFVSHIWLTKKLPLWLCQSFVSDTNFFLFFIFCTYIKTFLIVLCLKPFLRTCRIQLSLFLVRTLSIMYDKNIEKKKEIKIWYICKIKFKTTFLSLSFL